MRTWQIAAATVVAAAWGCSESKPNTGDDTSTDSPVDTGGDATDTPGEETPPPSCAGDETFAIAFEEDGSPLEDVAVAAACGDVTQEVTTGADGVATFTGFNISEAPVDVTFVHEDQVTTWLAYGGERGAPEVMEVDLSETDDQDGWMPFSGDIEYADPENIVIVSGPGGMRAWKADSTYSSRAPEDGTLLPVAFLEYSSTGDVATPVGFTSTTFDMPDGPTASADPSAVFESVDVTLTYDLAPESPIRERPTITDGPMTYLRPYLGMYVMNVWEDAGGEDVDFFVQAGITTAWSRGAGEDVLTVSWVPAALTEEPMAVLQVAAEDGFWLSSTYPDWPLDPATSIAVRDVPELPGLDPADAVGMGTIIEASYPEWGSIMSVNAYFSDGFGAFAQNVRWSVLIPPEGASFSFDSLPFPASADLEAVFPSAISDYRLGIAAIESTEDPWIDYVGWTEENWWEDRFVARTVDGRRAFEP